MIKKIIVSAITILLLVFYLSLGIAAGATILGGIQEYILNE